MLKVGLVGTGFISDEHVLGYRGCADAEIVAVCDLDLGRARGWLERWRLPAARAFDGIERMLDGEKLDLVEILTPQTQHYDSRRCSAPAPACPSSACRNRWPWASRSANA